MKESYILSSQFLIFMSNSYLFILIIQQGSYRFWLVVLLVVITVTIILGENDYYQLLGVSKTADNQEIRKAFKKLALIMHPDKNIDEPDAQEKFLNLKEAYEVLKDQKTRQTYDLYGEKGLKDGLQNDRQHQNWHFYENQFGIYDDDPEIITVTSAEFGKITV